MLAEAGMGVENLAKVTTYLSDRRYREENSRIRQEVLGDHEPALTIIICDIYYRGLAPRDRRRRGRLIARGAPT